jgi:hypothetical protein
VLTTPPLINFVVQVSEAGNKKLPTSAGRLFVGNTFLMRL